jgi:hypothetical protein
MGVQGDARDIVTENLIERALSRNRTEFSGIQIRYIASNVYSALKPVFYLLNYKRNCTIYPIVHEFP